MTEFFAREGIREMHFDEGQFHAQQGIAQRHAGMREAARIDDGEADAVAARRLHTGDELVFGIALEGDHLVAELRRGVLGTFFDRGQGVRTINLGLALP